MHNKYMKIAIDEAKKASKNGDIPVGCVVVRNNEIIAKAYNKKHLTSDPTNHAEIIAIRKACKKLGDFRLEDCDVYITLEPCIMCYGALLSARVNRIYFGAYDKKYSIMDLKDKISFNHSLEIVGGVLEEECSQMLSQFFTKLRSEKC